MIIVAENDSATVNTPDFVDAILRMYEWSAEPKELILTEGFFHGVSVLMGDQGLVAREAFFEFLGKKVLILLV